MLTETVVAMGLVQGCIASVAVPELCNWPLYPEIPLKHGVLYNG